MVTVNLSDGGKVSRDLVIARGRAIQAYTTLELSLHHFLAYLLGTDWQLAGIVFYRIVNTRSRNAIIDALYHKRHGKAHKDFWASLLKLIRQIDQRRNEIMHWHMQTEIRVSDDGGAPIGASLIPPQSWLDGNSPGLHLPDLMDFIERCDAVSRSLNVFNGFLSGQMTPRSLETWHGIFQQPIIYPLPDSHPLSQKREAPQAQQQPSPA